MWNSLVALTGNAPVIILLVLSLIIAGAAAFIFFYLIRPAMHWQRQLKQGITSLSTLRNNSIDHLNDLRKRINVPNEYVLRTRLDMLIDDSRQLFDSKWIPDPAGRIQKEDLHTPNWQKVEHLSAPGLLGFAGVFLSLAAFIYFWLAQPEALASQLLLIFLALPLLIGLLSAFLTDRLTGNVRFEAETNWHHLMLQLKRKLPVYSPDHETAVLINGFLNYDRLMNESVRQLTEQISLFSSQQLTDAITFSVRDVMTQTLAGPLSDSYARLTSLARQMAEKTDTNEKRLADLYLSMDQNQKSFFRELIDKQSKMYETLDHQLAEYSANQREQHISFTHAQSKFLHEQFNLMQQGQIEFTEHWGRLHEDLLKDLTAQIAASQSTIQTNQQTAMNDLTTQYNLTMKQLKEDQLTAWQQLDSRQLQTAEQFSQLLEKYQHELSQSLVRLDQNQAAAMQTALEKLAGSQRQISEDLAERQATGVQELLGQMYRSISEVLTSHLDPVSEKFKDAADVLKFAGQYANTVQETFAKQAEKSLQIQSDLTKSIGQFEKGQQLFSQNVEELGKAAGSMTGTSTELARLFTESQSGLNDAVGKLTEDMGSISDKMQNTLSATLTQYEQLITMGDQASEINQTQIEAINKQITHLSDELSTRIDQLLISFTRITEDLIHQVDNSIQNQNDSLSGSLRALTGTMEDEARSMSLYSQQINMDITELSQTLKESVQAFNQEIGVELTGVLNTFDSQIADVLSRFANAANELGDAVEQLPETLKKLER